MASLYYTPPADKHFDELKEKSMELWREVATHPGYLREKIEHIRDLKNIQDNFLVMVAMFDTMNQIKLAQKLSDETRGQIRDRMLDGGHPEFLIPF